MYRSAWKTVVIGGPTASGKTAIAIEVALRTNGEIINADSMQVYRGMDIGTAKPTADDQRKVPFHLIDLIEPDQLFTAAQWKHLAESEISAIRSRGRTPILCGGTGMYLRALLRNWTMAEQPRDVSLRRKLENDAANFGAPALHRRLALLDPETANRLHPNDAHRIVRALEVCIGTGTALSVYHSRDQESEQDREPFEARVYAPDLPREQLYERIDARVDSMMEEGLEGEVNGLIACGFGMDLPAMKSLGYKEMCSYLKGDVTRQAAVEQMKASTRRYAKRQITWFRAEAGITWIDASIFSSAEIADTIMLEISASHG